MLDCCLTTLHFPWPCYRQSAAKEASGQTFCKPVRCLTYLRLIWTFHCVPALACCLYVPLVLDYLCVVSPSRFAFCNLPYPNICIHCFSCRPSLPLSRPVHPFGHLVKTLTGLYCFQLEGLRWSVVAVEALQEAAEAFLVDTFQRATRCASTRRGMYMKHICPLHGHHARLSLCLQYLTKLRACFL